MIEKYEYLSLRDRESYSILRKYYTDLPGQNQDQVQDDGIAANIGRNFT